MSLPEPVPVVLVRPRKIDRPVSFLTTVGNYLLGGLVIMLLLPTFTPWHPSYWQAVAAVAVLRWGLPDGGETLLLLGMRRARR